MSVRDPGTYTLELEIKLSGATDVIARALRSEAVRPLVAGRPGTRLLRTVYFDTPDGQLRDRGVALRLRKLGGRWVQSLKTSGEVLGGLHEREEFERVVATPQPDFTIYDETDNAALFSDPDLRRRIQAVFGTSFRRTTRWIQLDSSRIELAYDRGIIEAGDRQAPICELELELKHGDHDSLYTLAERLCRDFELRLDYRSKAERGYALLSGTAEGPARARAISLSGWQPPTESFVAIAGECLRHLQANDRGIIDGADPEYVHQARVALRRLRAALALFRPVVGCPAMAAIDDELKELAHVLGAARDWDVFCTESLPRLLVQCEVQAGRTTLTGLAAAQRARATGFAREAIMASSYTLLILRVGAALRSRPWHTQPDPQQLKSALSIDTRAFARQMLERAWRRTRKRARAAHKGHPESYHPLRLAMKRMRYGGEFFVAIFPPKIARDFLRTLEKLQDHLGRLNDAATALRLASILREDCKESDAREMLGALRGYYVAHLASSARAAQRSWKAVKDSAPFWVQGH